MAKLFYTLEETAQKLGKTPEEVQEMAKRGAIQLFRDRDKVMFKVDQIDLLAGGDEQSGEIPLALDDSRLGGSGLGLQDSSLQDSGLQGSSPTGRGSRPQEPGLGDSGLALQDSSLQDSHLGDPADSREASGMGLMESDAGERGSARTQAAGEDELSLEAIGSGSGLLDLTRESDDTSLGAELLEEVYSSDDNVEIPANASGLFEAAGAESPGNTIGAAPAMAMAPMMMESYDGAWSGLGMGLLLGALVAMICVAVVTFVGLAGSTAGLTGMFAGSLMIWAGGLLAITLVFGLVGFFIGKATE